MTASCRRQDQSAIIFSSALSRLTNLSRIPGTHIGVRRVRASSAEVKNALRKQQLKLTASIVSKDIVDPNRMDFTIVEDGKTRRMTKQEKKKFKRKRAEKIKELKKQAQEVKDEEGMIEDETKSGTTHQQIEELDQDDLGISGSRYLLLPISQTAVEEELSELLDKRVPPVILSPPMVKEARRAGILKLHQSDGKCDIGDEITPPTIDNKISALWAHMIKETMKVAEGVRVGESLRPMAYQIVPEVWSRLRPSSLSTLSGEKNVKGARAHVSGENGKYHISGEDDKRWSFISTRISLPQFDDDLSIIYSVLQRDTNLHVGCGAKFGCDLMLYDGNRNERHSFAGIRACSRSTLVGTDNVPLYQTEEVVDEHGLSSSLPIPSAYDLAGYVRCLNTAGKLALIATVVRIKQGERDIFKVAVVDLALEKVLSAPTHKRKRSGKKSTQIRKDGGENLQKKNH